MKDLKEHIKNKKFINIYLFFGEEKYLISHYKKEFIKNVISEQFRDMNLFQFDGKETKVQDIINAAETPPFFDEKKLVIVTDSGLFYSGKKEESERLSNYLSNIPDFSVVLFIETNVDKRSAAYKKAAKEGCSVEFVTQGEKELSDWIIKLLQKNEVECGRKASLHLVKTAGTSMDTLYRECLKLASYKGSKGTVSENDIDEICTKSLEAKIFELVAYIGNKNSAGSLETLHNLLKSKEPVLMILTMIARQFRLILQCRHLAGIGTPAIEIERKTGLQRFVVNNCLSQSKNFTEDTLKLALADCLEADVKIKSGQINDVLAIEMLIIRYAR